MSNFVLNRSDVRVMLWHLTLYGLAAICEEAGFRDLRLSWAIDRTTSQTTNQPPRAVMIGPDGQDLADGEEIARAVRTHAQNRATDSSWLQRNITVKGASRGLMSPRLSTFPDEATWAAVRQARHEELDLLTRQHAWLDLRMLGALGEPSYWSHNRQLQPLQDDGASRLEMQPRNRGSEFVGSRLRKLAECVSTRSHEAVLSGLTGQKVVDEAGGDAVDSRTPTGLANPGPTDNATAWCALWGISQFPLAMRINATAVTSGHLGRSRQEWFYLPVWHGDWSPARLRSILASGQLRTAATAGLPWLRVNGWPRPWAASDAEVMAARQWLLRRGTAGIIRFPIERFGSDSAPERRAMRGERVELQ